MNEREAQLVAALTEAVNALRETRGPYANEDWVGFQVERAIEVGYELLSPPPPHARSAETTTDESRSTEDRRLDALPIMVVQEPVTGIGDFDRLLDEHAQSDDGEHAQEVVTVQDETPTHQSTFDSDPPPVHRALTLNTDYPSPTPVPVGPPLSLRGNGVTADDDSQRDGPLPSVEPLIVSVDEEGDGVGEHIELESVQHLSVAGDDGDNDVVVRPMTTADMTAVAHLLELEHGEEPDGDLINVAIFDELAFVAESDGHIVGCVYARLEPLDIAEVINVLVASRWRRLGLGNALMHAVETAAYFAGADAVTLYHSKMQMATPYEQPHNLYMKLGYVPVMLTENTTFFVKRVAGPQR